MRPTRWTGLAAGLLFVPSLALAQDIISARAGLVHHSDGRVLLNGKPLVHKATKFQELKENEYLRTEQGRAEILLTPGIFLRLGEDTHVQMLSSKLSDVRLRMLSGAALIEADEVEKSSSVTVITPESEVRLSRAGLYRLDLLKDQEPRLRVFAGEAVVTGRGAEYRLRAKKEIDLAGDFVNRKFNPEDTDALDRWSKRRANYLAIANVSASRLAYNSGASYSVSSWIWNPYFGMYTFLPSRNICWSPYGYGFYSPKAVYYLYNPPANYSASSSPGIPSSYNRDYGYNSVGATSAGTSGVVASSPSSPVSQGGDAAVSRGGGGDAGGGARR